MPTKEGFSAAVIGGFASFLKQAAWVRVDVLDLAANEPSNFQHRGFFIGPDVQDGVARRRKVCGTGRHGCPHNVINVRV